MSSSIPLDRIPGTPLNSEQKSYLEGLFAGIKNRGVGFQDVSPGGPATDASLSDLTFEERVKRELHPLDAYSLLTDTARTQKAPDRENIFRFKWQGLFYLSPQKESFMARLRIPGGQLKSYQLREIARTADELTSGYIQVTTRANLQLRLIEIKDAPEFLTRIQSLGLHTQGAGADNIRNITASPTAGFDPYELENVLPVCHRLGQLIIQSREFYDLPRKFNVAFDGGGLVGVVEETNDIGWKAVQIKEGSEVPPGIYYRCFLGGATGHLAIGKDLGVLVRLDELVDVTAALIRVYIQNGNRNDRKKARLKHLLESWSLEQYLTETEKLLGRPIRKLPPQWSQFEVRSPRTAIPHPQVGVFPQKQPGLNYIGVGFPAGQVTSKQLIRLAELAENYGQGEVRLTVWQNIILPHIPDAYLETVKKAIQRMGLHWRQSNVSSGVVACTGNSYCKYASANTKGHALALIKYLEKKFELDQPINIHLTGCAHSCAQHYIGDIGLLSTKVKISGETVEGYHVFVGGGFGDKQAIGRQVFTGVPESSLNSTLEKMLHGWLKNRKPAEPFQEFASRHDLNSLQVLFSPEG